ncbi:MAG: putative toxin-antitoxin system toxin component, PIN family [Terracidiphilus sp.]
MPSAPRPRIVIDTNIFVSQVLNYLSKPSLAVLKAEQTADILISKVIFDEIAQVLRRRKLERYISAVVREAAMERIRSITTWIEPPTPIRACRDPRDDKFLEVAVHGRADVIDTGDTDLLALHPFRGIAILTPTDYLERK